MKFQFEIDIDISVLYEAEFLDWYEQNPDKFKSMLFCGYFMATQGVDAYFQNTLENNWISKYSKLEKEHKEQMAFCKDQFKQHLSTLQTCNPDIEYWRNKYDNLNKEYTNYIKDKQIKNLEDELNIFKNTNQYKGAIGEKTIKDILNKSFIGYEIKDTSGLTNMSDIHLIDKDNNIIAIECKNKSIITLQDVEKSLLDIKILKEQFGDKFIGYMFISIRSNNIPKKGDLFYEVIESRPVIWYAANTVIDTDITNIIKLLISHKNIESSNIDINNTISKMNSYLKKLSENKKAIENIKTGILNVQKNNDWIYQDIIDYIGVTSKEECFKCIDCNLIFKRKNELTKHNNKEHKNLLIN
jgi:hypothetical protein